MGLFDSKEEKDAKKEAKLKEAMAKYGLQDISDDYAPYVRDIQLELMGNKLIEFGTALQGNGVDSAKMSYLSAIMKQNWIIIRLLDEIAKSK